MQQETPQQAFAVYIDRGLGSTHEVVVVLDKRGELPFAAAFVDSPCHKLQVFLHTLLCDRYQLRPSPVDKDHCPMRQLPHHGTGCGAWRRLDEVQLVVGFVVVDDCLRRCQVLA